MSVSDKTIYNWRHIRTWLSLGPGSVVGWGGGGGGREGEDISVGKANRAGVWGEEREAELHRPFPLFCPPLGSLESPILCFFTH